MEFPDFVKNLPEADLPVKGLHGYLLQSESGQVLFLDCKTDTFIPEHSHCDQWGFVIDGKMELIIEGKKGIYTCGSNYFIPKGTPHKAHLFAGFKACDVFADKDRYKPKK